MLLGIRTQVLVILALVLGFGLVGTYLVTSDLTRTEMVQGRIREARSATALVAERFVGVPTEGLAIGEVLARVRPIAAPDQVYVLDQDFEPILDSHEVRARFRGLVRPGDLESLGAAEMRHAVLDSPAGEPVLAVLAPFEGAPRRPGRDPVATPGAVCLLSPLAPALARIEGIESLYLFFTMTLLAAATVLGYFILGRVVIRPVEQLQRYVEEVGASAGQASARIRGPRASGELGQLFRSFGRMTEQLADDRRRIQLQISELEHANREIESAQERLIRTEKLASVGELAAGLAHEIGNPIGVVQGYLEILQDPSLPEAQRLEFVEVMQGSIDRVSTIIRDLLDFARPDDDAVHACDAVATCAQAAKLVGPQKRFKELRLDLQVPDAPAWVAMPAGRLEQVLLNLLLNAADASPPEASIRLAVTRAAAGASSQALDPPPPDEVHIAVHDTGSGIPPGVLARIFDPFFTTKDPGEGTGLGLSICYSLVQTYQGRLEVESGSGRGTTFTIVLPAAATHADLA